MTAANISAQGISCTVVSTVTFPYGFSIKEDFPDDVDPITIGNQTVRSSKMLVDGSLYTYITAKPIEVTISVLPGTKSDTNLGVILSASKVQQQLIPLPDSLSLVISYPDGVTATLIMGSMVSGPPARGVSRDGRIKTNQYQMVFQDSVTIGNSVVGSIASIASAAMKILG